MTVSDKRTVETIRRRRQIMLFCWAALVVVLGIFGNSIFTYFGLTGQALEFAFTGSLLVFFTLPLGLIVNVNCPRCNERFFRPRDQTRGIGVIKPLATKCVNCSQPLSD